MKTKALLLSLMIAANGFAQGVIDVHSHIITPEFVLALETEGRVMDEGFPLPKYNVENHLRWMGDALWINASNHNNRASLIENWLKTTSV